jgi:NADH pyrophosphatase NudC (nudix superfamily)
MATLDIPLRGMTVVEICRAYPEQVAAAIERHNSEVAPSASANIARDESCPTCCDAAMLVVFASRHYRFCPMCGGKLSPVA